MHNHSDERLRRIEELAQSLSAKGVLVSPDKAIVVGGSGGGSFMMSSSSANEKNRSNVMEEAKTLGSKWTTIAKQAGERISILERSIAEAQEWEYKLIAVQDWLQGKFWL